MAIVIKGLMIEGSQCHQTNSCVVCDGGYVKYEEAEVDRLVAIGPILKKIAAAGAATVDRVEYSKQHASVRTA